MPVCFWWIIKVLPKTKSFGTDPEPRKAPLQSLCAWWWIYLFGISVSTLIYHSASTTGAPALNMHTWWILYSEMAPRGLASSFCPLATFTGAYYFGKSLTRISVFHILKGSKNIINWLANVYLWLLRCEVKIHGHKEQHHSRHWCHKQLVMYIAGVKRCLGQLMGRLRVNLRFQYNNLKGPSVIFVDVESLNYYLFIGPLLHDWQYYLLLQTFWTTIKVIIFPQMPSAIWIQNWFEISLIKAKAQSHVS